MKRYNEIMEHVQVDKAMEKEILSNLSSASLTKPKKTSYAPWLALVGGLAAVMVFFMVVHPSGSMASEAASSTESLTDTTTGYAKEENSQVMYQSESYTTLQELNQALGFQMVELRVPFPVEEETYTMLGNELGEITYTGSKESITYRMGPTGMNISGDYNSYTDATVLSLENLNITLQGEDSTYVLATWEVDSYSYSISSEQGMSEEEWKNFFKDIINPK